MNESVLIKTMKNIRKHRGIKLSLLIRAETIQYRSQIIIQHNVSWKIFYRLKLKKQLSKRTNQFTSACQLQTSKKKLSMNTGQVLYGYDYKKPQWREKTKLCYTYTYYIIVHIQILPDMSRKNLTHQIIKLTDNYPQVKTKN